MRCACAQCGTYMAHADGLPMGCVCPACGARCTACLGAGSVLNKEQLRALAESHAWEGRDSQDG